MGPMGPMMGGGAWGSGMAGGLAFGFLVILLLALGLVVLAITHGGSPGRRRAVSPEEALRERYVRGEISQQQYQQALVDLLKGRYLQGEIELDEYEVQLGRLFGDRPRGQFGDRPRGQDEEPARGPVPGARRVDVGKTMRRGE